MEGKGGGRGDVEAKKWSARGRQGTLVQKRTDTGCILNQRFVEIYLQAQDRHTDDNNLTAGRLDSPGILQPSQIPPVSLVKQPL